MSTVTLLGPQIREPILAPVLHELGIRGPFAAITAGWQEREGEIEELASHVQAPVTDLGLYARTEDVFARDPELAAAHRARQKRLREMQSLYRLQLAAHKQVARELFEREGRSRNLLHARRQAIAAIRRLDRSHLRAIQRVHAAFDAKLQSLERPAIREHQDQLAPLIRDAGAILISGGHVAVLLSRLRLFGGAQLFGGKPIIAWSAGAMVACESVVLFHDQPPQGASHAEVFDAGFALVPNVRAFPYAQTRLRLHDAPRIAIMARRFTPAACLTLDTGTCVHFRDGRLAFQHASWQLSHEGALMQPEAS